MKAMLLAAGEGRRLRPITDTLPKPMIPIAGKPILEYNVELLKKHGVWEIAVNLHHCAETIVNHFGNGARWGVSIMYSHEPELLGTAGAVKKLEPFFDATFLVLYGDNLSNCDLTRLVACHRDGGGIGTVALFPREDVTASGIVEVDGEGRITRFLEKPRSDQVFSHLVSAGILVLEPRMLRYVPKGQFYDFGRDLLPQLLQTGEQLDGYVMDEDLFWIDTLADYQRVQSYVDEGRFQL